MISDKLVDGGKMKLLPIVFLVTGFTASGATDGCPTGCICGMDSLYDIVSAECWNVDVEEKIKDLPTTLTHLNIRHSSVPVLQSGMFQKFQHLRSLILSDDNITEILAGAFIGLKKLALLDLRENNITVIGSEAFVDIKAVITIIISSNKLEEIHQKAFDGLRRLQSLYLNNNALKNLTCGCFNSLVNLDFLDLSENEIGEVEECAFKALGNLTVLNLAHNKIIILKQELVLWLKKLKTLKLDSSQLKFLRPAMRQKGKLGVLTLEDIHKEGAKLVKTRRIGIPIVPNIVVKRKDKSKSYSENLVELRKFYAKQSEKFSSEKLRSSVSDINRGVHSQIKSYSERLQELSPRKKSSKGDLSRSGSSYSQKLSGLIGKEASSGGDKKKHNAMSSSLQSIEYEADHNDKAPQKAQDVKESIGEALDSNPGQPAVQKQGVIQNAPGAPPSPSRGALAAILTLGALGIVGTGVAFAYFNQKRRKRWGYFRVEENGMETMDLLTPPMTPPSSYGTSNEA